MTNEIEAFLAQVDNRQAIEPPKPDGPPRDRWDRPLVIPPGGGRPKAYHRASSFGGQIDDTYNLVRWQKRQVARGMAVRVRDALAQGKQLMLPTLDEPTTTAQKNAWNAQYEAAEEAAGSNVKSALGTAIHAATERVDKGESTADMAPHLRERAAAYWHFCQTNGIHPTSVEVFGVEDEHHVAGTWDRTGWWAGRHKILDVKTSGSMDYAGIVFAVQLAEYAHMSAYDWTTGERTPHELMDLEEAIIIHVGREEGSHVELYKVDITVGWEYAVLVDQVKKAQREGKHAIRPVDEDDVSQQIIAARSLDALREIYDGSWNTRQRKLASAMAGQLRLLAERPGALGSS